MGFRVRVGTRIRVGSRVRGRVGALDVDGRVGDREVVGVASAHGGGQRAWPGLGVGVGSG